MPAMIAHHQIGRRVLAETEDLGTIDRAAFLLGTQGPDILYFFRAYPWLIGENGLPYGNALHEASPSALMDALWHAVQQMPPEDRPIAESYALGFLCHYAVDRTVHPFVCAMQERMMKEDPSYATDSNPYHYRIESALDTILYTRETEKNVRRFSLVSLVPPQSDRQDAVIGRVMALLIRHVLHKPTDGMRLSLLRADMRHSMWWMTDHTGFKKMALRTMEILLRKDAWYSSLVRTPHVAWYDFANTRHEAWGNGDTADLFELCDRSVALTQDLIRRWRLGEPGMVLTGNIDFSGLPYHDKGETIL